MHSPTGAHPAQFPRKRPGRIERQLLGLFHAFGTGSEMPKLSTIASRKTLPEHLMPSRDGRRSEAELSELLDIRKRNFSRLQGNSAETRVPGI